MATIGDTRLVTFTIGSSAAFAGSCWPSPIPILALRAAIRPRTAATAPA